MKKRPVSFKDGFMLTFSFTVAEALLSMVVLAILASLIYFAG